MTTLAPHQPTRTAETPAVAQVRRYYQLVDDGDVPGLVDLFTPDGTYHRPGYPPLVGRAEVEGFYRATRVIRTGRHTLRTIVATGDEVAVHGEFHGVLNDGSEVDLRFADFFRLTPGCRFSRRDTFFFAPLV